MLTIGKTAPAFSLPSTDGGTATLAALRGKVVVLYFYPRDNTPGCTIEAQDFRDVVPELQKLGAVVFGVSKDSIKTHCGFRDKYRLNFPLLTDDDGKTLAAYGAWGEKSMYGKAFMGIIRSTTIIDESGNVLKHYPKVSIKGHAADVVATIAAHKEGAAQAKASKPAKASKAPKANLPAGKKVAAKSARPAKAAKPAKPAKAAKPATKAKTSSGKATSKKK